MPRSTLVPALAAVLAAPMLTASAAAAPPPDVVEHSTPGASIALEPRGAYETGVFDESAAEIVQWYAARDRALVVSAFTATVQVLDVADPDDPRLLFELVTEGVRSADGSTVPAGATANSVAVREDGLALVAVEAPTKTDRGWLVAFDVDGTEPVALGAVRVGALPDMVTLTEDGRRAVVANEGEPAEDYSVDPEGSVSVVGLRTRVAAPRQPAVRTAGFRRYDRIGVRKGVRIFGGREDAGTGVPTRPVSETLEPEYVTTVGRHAYVTLQEANALAKVDLDRARVVRVVPLGTVDRMTTPFDPSDRDDAVAVRRWPVRGFRMPDAIDSFTLKGRTYLVTADEGDSRDWEAYGEEARVKDLGSDGLPPVCASVAEQTGTTLEELVADENLGRLTITTAQGLDADGSCYRTLHALGGRSMSVLDANGRLIGSTGAMLERVTAKALPEHFNSDHGSSAFDDRSDAKGPEPEGVVVGRVGGTPYAFLGLERVGGVAVFDLSNPRRPRFVTYLNTRDFSVDGETDLAAAGDLGPEGLAFVKASASPTGRSMLAVAHEVSGTTRFYDVTRLD